MAATLSGALFPHNLSNDQYLYRYSSSDSNSLADRQKVCGENLPKVPGEPRNSPGELKQQISIF